MLLVFAGVFGVIGGGGVVVLKMKVQIQMIYQMGQKARGQDRDTNNLLGINNFRLSLGGYNNLAFLIFRLSFVREL